MIAVTSSVFKALLALVERINRDGMPGTLRIYAGPIPSSLEDAVEGTLLATLTCLGDPVFDTSDYGQIYTDANKGGDPLAVARGDAAASGTATVFRFFDPYGNKRLQGTVGASGSGADLILSSTSIASGQTITITSFRVTLNGCGPAMS